MTPQTESKILAIELLLILLIGITIWSWVWPYREDNKLSNVQQIKITEVYYGRE